MYCINCGTQILDDSKFCYNCGQESESNNIPIKKEIPKSYNQAIHLDTPTPQKVKKHSFRKFVKVVSTLLLTMPILTVLILFTISAVNNFPIRNDAGKSQQLAEMSNEEVSLNEYTQEMSPNFGTVGTLIQISGDCVKASSLDSAMINDQELNIKTTTPNLIELYVTYGAESGNIILTFEDEIIDAGYFEVIEQEKNLVIEEDIRVSESDQRVSSENISITLPGNVVDSTQTIRIEEILEPNNINLPNFTRGSAYSVTLGDMHQFDDFLTIEYTIPEDAEGEPSVAYFNEETSLWHSMHNEVVDGKLIIYTDHLTDILIFYWGESIYSSEGYFKIFYQKSHKSNYKINMDEFAISVGDTLEKARKDYDKIPAAYRDIFTTGIFKDSIDVYLDSAYEIGEYNSVNNNIYLPTNYSGQEEFEVTVAHELFHAYQDPVLGNMGMIRDGNIWAKEALAELAAQEFAFPSKGRKRKLSEFASPKYPYSKLGYDNEYNMASFLGYMLKTSNSEFVELWTYIASDNEYLIENSMANFFRSKSPDFISLGDSYTSFWRDVVGNADAPTYGNLKDLFRNGVKALRKMQHTLTLSYPRAPQDTMAFHMIMMNGFEENVPVRIFNVESTTDNGAYITQLTGIKDIEEVNSRRVTGGFDWGYVSKGSENGAYKRYEFRQGQNDVLVIGFESLVKGLPSITMNEITAQCAPSKIENGLVGKEYEFEFSFNNIFENATKLLVEVDYGDGEVTQYNLENENITVKEVVEHRYEKLITTAVTCSLYDITGDGKILISQIHIPVVIDQELMITAYPKPVAPQEVVTMSVNLEDARYTYKWDFGNGDTISGAGISGVEYPYEFVGSYPATVSLYDEEDKLIGVAQVSIEVALPEVEGSSSKWKWSGETLTLEGVEWRFISILTFYADGSCSMQFGSEGRENSGISMTVMGIYTLNEIMSQGTVTFPDAENGGNMVEPFTLNGGTLMLDYEEYERIN